MESPIMQPTHMLVAQVARQGGPEFTVETVPTPSPGPGQVLIKVESAGVNFSDVKRRRGDAYPFPTSFPFVPGGEIAGTVVAHGPGVDAPPVGAKVFALAGADGTGGYAQYALAYAPTAIPFPDPLGFDAASVLLVAGATAEVLLTRTAHLRKGESVLIPAATGGVGSFAVQIAKRIGAGKILAGVGSAAKGPKALALGADAFVVSSDPGWPDQVRELAGGKGVDVALESTGEAGLVQTFRALAAFGRLIVYGAATGTSAALDPATLERWLYAPAANQSIAGFNIGGWFMERPGDAAAALTSVIEGVLSGELTLPKISALPLREARKAHLALEGRATEGKLVIEPWA